MKNIYLIVGPSGVGKTTLVDTLSSLFGYKVVESYTTRPKRNPNETGHRFVTDAEFDALGELCAYTEFNGYRYGVPTAMVDECDLYVIDPAGVKYLESHYHGKGVKVIGLTADAVMLANRMRGRGDGEEAIASRLGNDLEAFSELASIADILIAAGTDNVDQVAKKVKHFIDECETTVMFRCESFCGDGVRDARKIIAHEIDELGNTDILETLLENGLLTDKPPITKYPYPEQWLGLSIKEKAERIVKETTNGEVLEDLDGADYFALADEILASVHETTGHTIKYALWLADKGAIQTFYGINMENPYDYSMYAVGPVILSDLGCEGKLFGYEEMPELIKNPDKEAIPFDHAEYERKYCNPIPM